MSSTRSIENHFTVNRRQHYSDVQRKAIRDFKREQSEQGQSCSQQSIIDWFKQKYGIDIDQSTISRILSKQYDFLDGARKLRKNAYRHRKEEWPLLEAALFEWQQRAQNAKMTITGDLLKARARDFWPRIDAYKNQQMPKFSDGWLDGFKKRHHIRDFKQHGEAGSVDASAEDRMEEIRKLTAIYGLEDI